MNTKLKRILSLSLALLMVLSLAACGKEDGGSTQTGAKPQAQETPEFAYVSKFKSLDVADDSTSFNPQVYTDDGIYVISYEKIGEEIPEGVTPEYEGQYDKYGSFLYLMDYEGGLKKLEGYQPLPAPENSEGLKDFNSSSDLSSIKVADDGRICAIEDQYQSWSEAPDGVSKDSEEYWQYYQNKNVSFLRWLNEDGSEISSAALQVPEDQYLNTYSTTLDSQGNLLTSTNPPEGGTDLLAFAPDGSIAYSIHSDEYMDSPFKLADGRAAVGFYGENGMKAAVINEEKKSMDEEVYDIEGNVDLYNCIPGGDGYDIFFTSGMNFYGLKLAEGTPVKLFSWLDCDVNGQELGKVHVGSDGVIRALMSEYDSKKEAMKYDLLTVEKVPYASVPHKDIITLAVMYLDYNASENIIKFNRSSDSIRIQVKDYSEYNNEENQYQGGITKLNTEIMAGNIPDILDVRNLNYSQLASKGIIEDLYPYIDNDPELKREDFFPNVLKAMEVNGKLCTTVPGFYISTVLGASSVVGEEPGWNYEAFDQALASMPEGCQPFDPYVTRDIILSNCLALEMNNFVDWSSGKCSFDSQEFIDLLEFAARFPKDFDWETMGEEVGQQSTQERLASGQQMLVQTTVYSLDDLFYNSYNEVFGGNSTFIGYPTSQGVGNGLGVDGVSYAMSASSPYKDQIWQFLRTFMTKEYQEEDVYSLASRVDIFEDKAKEATTIQYQKDADGKYILDENGEKIPVPRYGRYNELTGETEEIYALDPAQIDVIRQLIADTDRMLNNGVVGSELFDIVTEGAEAFFQGQKSAQDVAKLIQSKANIYVNEQR